MNDQNETSATDLPILNLESMKQRAGRLPSVVTATIPEFGRIRIRVLSPTEHRTEYRAWLRPGGKLSKTRREYHEYRLVEICLLNGETNTPMFDSVDSTVAFFGDIPGLFTQVAVAVMTANNLTDDRSPTFEASEFEKKSDI